jgi:hypothetical protein
MTQLRALEKKRPADDQTNWVTAFFMGRLSHWRRCGAVFLYMESCLHCDFPLVGIRKLRHRDGLSSATRASRLQDSEVGRVFSDRMRHSHSRRRSDLLGGTHRIRHQFADQKGDPHSPRDGKWWSHMGWILTGRSMHHDTTTLARYVPDLAKDKFPILLITYPLLIRGCAEHASFPRARPEVL